MKGFFLWILPSVRVSYNNVLMISKINQKYQNYIFTEKCPNQTSIQTLLEHAVKKTL